jgi:hypothetical protein
MIFNPRRDDQVESIGRRASAMRSSARRTALRCFLQPESLSSIQAWEELIEQAGTEPEKSVEE